MLTKLIDIAKTHSFFVPTMNKRVKANIRTGSPENETTLM